MEPKVSVVMPVYRPDPVHLAEAVDSVLAQTINNWELVIVEDPSDRMGREVVESRRESRIRYQLNEQRTGLARQHNRAVTMSQAPLIARFDADDICEPDRLEKQLAFMEAHPEIDVLASLLTIIDETGRVVGFRDYPLVHDELVRAMHRYNPISGSNAMFRRKVVETVGGWREDDDRPAQDYEWYSRVATRGFRLATHPDRLVRYRRHGAQIKSMQLRETIATTLEVKRRYWLSKMGIAARLTYWAEHGLRVLPAPLIMWLLETVRYRRSG